MSNQREIEVFGLSFMDVISCGLGGMLVLMFVFSTMVRPEGLEIQDEADRGMSRGEVKLRSLQRSFFVLNVEVTSTSSAFKYIDKGDQIWTLSSSYDDENSISRHIAIVNREDNDLSEFEFELEIPASSNPGENSFIKLISNEVSILPIEAGESKKRIRVYRKGTGFKLSTL